MLFRQSQRSGLCSRLSPTAIRNEEPGANACSSDNADTPRPNPGNSTTQVYTRLAATHPRTGRMRGQRAKTRPRAPAPSPDGLRVGGERVDWISGGDARHLPSAGQCDRLSPTGSAVLSLLMRAGVRIPATPSAALDTRRVPAGIPGALGTPLAIFYRSFAIFTGRGNPYNRVIR